MDDNSPAPDAILRRLYHREEALLRRLRSGEDSPEVRADLEAVRAAIRRRLRHENGVQPGDAPENGLAE